LGIISTSALAQLQQQNILEIPIRSDHDYFEIVSTRSTGLVLYRLLSSAKVNHLEITHTDTSFATKWAGTIQIDKGLTLNSHFSSKDQLSFLFHEKTFSNANFTLFQVDLKSGTYAQFNIKNFIPFLPTNFEVTEQGALIGGYFARVPLVIFFNTTNYQSKVLPGLFNEPGELAQIHVNENNSFDVLIGAKNYQKQKTLWIKNYDAEGNLIRNIMLDPGVNNSLLFGRTVKSINNNELIAGVYGSKNSDYSRGMFIASVDKQGDQLTRFYNFADLENFFKYMKAKREKRIKERIARRKIKGKKIRFSYRFLVHELVPHQNEFVFLGEAFYPKYRSSSSGTGISSYNNLIFDGFQYTHAVVIGINNEGELVWDNSFEINDVKTFTLEQFVKMDTQNNQIVLLYIFQNEIRTKIIRDNTVIEGKTYNHLIGGFDNITTTDRSIDVSKLDYWYGNTFYASGIKSTPGPKGRGRNRVFYVTKISYQ
jgi:hypothetical protein